MVTDLENNVKKALSKVVDPELGISITELGLVRTVKDEGEGRVTVEFTATSPFCPIAFFLAKEVKRVAARVEGVKKVNVILKGHVMEDEINRKVNEEG
ncbi:MAG: iron-sulfur cluster assembly protein [Candidatus Nezhaarchaeales archaeon]